MSEHILELRTDSRFVHGFMDSLQEKKHQVRKTTVFLYTCRSVTSMGTGSAALYLEPLLLFNISFVRLSLVAFASILLILADTFNVVLVVITPV